MIKTINLLHGVYGDKFVVVLSGYDNQSDWMLDLAFNAIINYIKTVYPYKNVVTVVKQHPDEPVGRDKEILKIAKSKGLNFVHVVQFEDTSKLIHAADLIITIPTTCIIEAILMNKPIIVIDKLYKNNKYAWQEIIKHLQDSKEINKKVMEALV